MCLLNTSSMSRFFRVAFLIVPTRPRMAVLSLLSKEMLKYGSRTPWLRFAPDLRFSTFSWVSSASKRHAFVFTSSLSLTLFAFFCPDTTTKLIIETVFAILSRPMDSATLSSLVFILLGRFSSFPRTERFSEALSEAIALLCKKAYLWKIGMDLPARTLPFRAHVCLCPPKRPHISSSSLLCSAAWGKCIQFQPILYITTQNTRETVENMETSELTRPGSNFTFSDTPPCGITVSIPWLY